MRVLKLQSARNVRDFGGLPVRDGRRVKPGLFYRSALLHNLSPADVRELFERRGIRTIIDLRTGKEREDRPDTVPDGVDYVPVPLLSDRLMGITHEKEETPPAKPEIPDLADLYRAMMSDPDSLNALKTIFEIIPRACEKGPVLWHCSEGKDRCGIVSALFLCLLGADLDTVFEEYLLTNRSAVPRARRRFYRTLLRERDWRFAWSVRRSLTVHRRYLTAAFDTVTERCGSLDRFFERELGLTPDLRERLRASALEFGGK